MKPTLVILAAGIGSRYGGLKQIDQVGPSGETILDYSIFDAIRAGFGKIVFVIRKDIEQDIKQVFGDKLSGKVVVDYVFQDLHDVPAWFTIPAERAKPWGTAHAVLTAATAVNEPFAVINADDFYGAGAYKVMAEFLSTQNNDTDNYAMVGYELRNTLSEYGSVSRGICETDMDGMLSSVVERTHIERLPQGVVFKDDEGNLISLDPQCYVSMNFWGFTSNVFNHIRRLFDVFLRENTVNPKAEFYIPTYVNTLVAQKEATVKVLTSSDKWFGVTYREDKPLVINKINELVLRGLYPKNLWE